MSKLQDDLLVEIMMRLPDARSAFRCKSVCKRWSSLISNPYLGRRFLSHHHQQGRNSEAALLLSSLDAQSSILSFLPVPDDLRRYFFVLSSCKDLVLCGFEVPKKNEYNNSQQLRRLFFVCNPFTKQWIGLPMAPDRSTEHEPRSLVSLVCESDGKDEVFMDLFRVVSIAGSTFNLKVDLFCSESGEWRKEALNMDDFGSAPYISPLMAWCNDKLYWQTVDSKLAVWNPFRPDTPLTFIDAPTIREQREFPQVWASQGALHVVCISGDLEPGGSWCILCVWRWGEEDGGRTWSRVYAVSLQKLVRSNDDEFPESKPLRLLALHPSDPGIAFLEFSCDRNPPVLVYSLNLRTRELNFFAGRTCINWRVFHPRFTCWPHPIPSYEELQHLHSFDGSYSWFRKSIKSTRAQTTAVKCQLVEGVKHSVGRPRKHNNSSTSQPRRPVKKAKGNNDQLVDAIHALQAIPDLTDEQLLDAWDLFEDDSWKARVFLAWDGRIRKKWLLRELSLKGSV